MIGHPFGPPFGLKIYVVPTWTTRPGYLFRQHTPVLSKAAGRRGTRRAAKRRSRGGWRWGMVPCEPDHVLKSGDTVYCTAQQYSVIKRAA
jgi:hypothetical protein